MALEMQTERPIKDGTDVQPASELPTEVIDLEHSLFNWFLNRLFKYPSRPFKPLDGRDGRDWDWKCGGGFLRVPKRLWKRK